MDLVNQERFSRGLAPLAVNLTLNYAAWQHSNQMAVRSKAFPSNPAQALQHTLFGVTGPTVSSRLDFAGYDNWLAYGENIAFGYTTAIAVMQGWMNSPGHRANILNPNFKEIGVAVATNAQGFLFWTQEFGSR
ncbi:MAG: CAP domain-containing protein [Gemmataceae bacterium]|nr:CAP domain-containing protein [Gemmataceae bacterium]